jgi:hypothetical protein
MGLENYGEGLRAVLNLINNPAAARQIQALPEAVSGGVGQLLRTFEQAGKSGLLGDAAKQKLLYGGPAPKAGPIPTKAQEATQLNLPLRTQTGRPVTSSVPRPTLRNKETLQNLSRPRAVDAPRVPRFGEVPGQLRLDAAPVPEFSYSGPYVAPRPEWGPMALPVSVREADSETLGLLKTLQPGTVDSLARLADDLANEYGVPAGEALKNITGPKGTDYLAYLNTSRKLAAVPDTRPVTTAVGDSGLVPPATPAGSIPGGPGGALIPSPAGGVALRTARETAPEFIDAEFRIIRDLPEAAQRGAVPSATQNLSAIFSRSGLSPAQLAAIAGGAGAVGLAAGIPLLREKESDPSLRLTDEQLYPPGQVPSSISKFDSRDSGKADSSVLPGGRVSPPMGSTGRGRSVVGQTGSGQVVVAQDDQESNYRQARANALAGVPKTPGEFSKIADYYKAREAYATQPEVRAQLTREASMIPGAAPQTPTWAAANPTLAYEMIQRAKARPDLSQQTPQAQGMTVGAQMGDNSNNNFVGNVESAGSAVIDRSSGAADLEDATRPLVRPTLNRIPLGGRMIPLGGGYPTVPLG